MTGLDVRRLLDAHARETIAPRRHKTAILLASVREALALLCALAAILALVEVLR